MSTFITEAKLKDVTQSKEVLPILKQVPKSQVMVVVDCAKLITATEAVIVDFKQQSITKVNSRS